MLTPEQIAEYQTERKALAVLQDGVIPRWAGTNEAGENEYCPVRYGKDHIAPVFGTFLRTWTDPLLALAAAHDALGITIEECPVVAAYRDALVEETARRMWAEDRLGEASESPYEWSEVYDKEHWRREARNAIAVKEE